VRTREIESKFRIESYAEAKRILATLYPEAETVLIADTIDTYYEVPGRADFVRLRNSWGATSEGIPKKLKEITVKRKDKGDNVNRLELNLKIESIETARAILNLALGPSTARIDKHELVYFLGGNEHTVISVCRIGREIFLEVEADSLESVERHVERIGRELSLKPSPKSLFELYVEAGGRNEKKD